MPEDQSAQTQFPFFEALKPSVSSQSRMGNATCRTRLEGWIRMVAARSRIWGRIDLEAFCHTTGYSREHATRTLSIIRNQVSDLVFETKICQRKKNGAKRWGVIVAERSKLRFDGYSLFFNEEGRWLHNYTNLGHGGEKIPPTRYRTAEIHSPRSHLCLVSKSTTSIGARSNSRYPSSKLPIIHSSVTSKVADKPVGDFSRKDFPLPSSTSRSSCDNSSYGKGSFGPQQIDLNGAEHSVVQQCTKAEGPARNQASDRLRRKAFAMLKPLEHLHWDNCKVTFSARSAFCYALDALSVGHESARITRCYERALFTCHGLATDVAAGMGEPFYFNPSSTISKARKMLEIDGLSASDRMKLWYRNRQISTPPMMSPPIPSNPAELCRMIAESLGCGDADDTET